MDRDSRKMLSFIQSSSVCSDGFCSFSDFYDAYASHTGLPEQRIMACLRFLESSGFIRYGQDQSGRNVGFELEHKAYCWRYYASRSFFLFLGRSVLVPIAVSILTARLTMWLSQL